MLRGGAMPGKLRTAFAVSLVGFGLLLGPIACGKPTKQEIMERSRDVRFAAELKKVLGEPDHFEAKVMFEQWTYEASDGKVQFHIAGERIIFRSTVSEEDEEKAAKDD